MSLNIWKKLRQFWDSGFALHCSEIRQYNQTGKPARYMNISGTRLIALLSNCWYILHLENSVNDDEHQILA
jgi:hypothetical protein